MVQLAQPMAPAMGGPRSFAPPQPVQQQRDPSATEMLTQMAQERAMGAAVDKGAELTATGMSKAGTAIKGALMPAAASPVTTSALANQAAMTQAAGLAAPAASTAAGTAAAGAGGAGMMAAMGTAMPYVGAGLLAGKALGLFSAGGQIGPLGNPSKVKYSYGGGKVEKEQVELTYGPLGGR